MYIIEPCCTQKHWPALLQRLKGDDIIFFHGYGDLSLSELLPVILTAYNEIDMVLVSPSLPDSTARVLISWMRKQWARMDGKGSLNVIGHLTIVTNLNKEKSPLASTWQDKSIFGPRLQLRNVQQNDTALIFPDLAIYGNINLSYGGHFSAIVTRNARIIQSLRSLYDEL